MDKARDGGEGDAEKGSQAQPITPTAPERTLVYTGGVLSPHTSSSKMKAARIAQQLSPDNPRSLDTKRVVYSSALPPQPASYEAAVC